MAIIANRCGVSTSHPMVGWCASIAQSSELSVDERISVLMIALSTRVSGLERAVNEQVPKPFCLPEYLLTDMRRISEIRFGAYGRESQRFFMGVRRPTEGTTFAPNQRVVQNFLTEASELIMTLAQEPTVQAWRRLSLLPGATVLLQSGLFGPVDLIHLDTHCCQRLALLLGLFDGSAQAKVLSGDMTPRECVDRLWFAFQLLELGQLRFSQLQEYRPEETWNYLAALQPYGEQVPIEEVQRCFGTGRNVVVDALMPTLGNSVGEAARYSH